MKVKDMLSKLRTLNPELDVLCYCEDEGHLPDKHEFRVFEINSVDLTEAEKTRGEDGVASLRLGKTESSSSHVLIEITSDL